jgi:cytochrome c
MIKSFSLIGVGIALTLTASAFGAPPAVEKKVTKDSVSSKVAAPATAAPAPATTAPTTAAPTDAEKKLAEESAAFCKTTAATKATPQMIVEKVKEACALLEKEGAKAIPKFQGNNSPFIFGGTFLIVNKFDGTMIMHTMMPAMNGKNHMELKDKNGKTFFADMIKLCKEKSEGWLDYYWPKTGEKEPSLKVSYAHKAKCDGQDVVVWCGIYGTTLADVEKAFAAKK